MTRLVRRQTAGTIALVALMALPACASLPVAVEPGHAAVLMTADGNRTVLGEGENDVPPGALVDDFDLRQQSQGGSFTALTADGVPVAVGDPIVSYALAPDELIEADRAVGPNGARALIAPIVQSTIAGVLAGYRWDQLDTARIREAQARITELAAARLRPYHLVLSAVELKGLTPRLPGAARAVAATSIWEQRSLEAQTNVEVARERADRLRQQGEGLAAAYRSIAPTLTPEVLADKSNRAWQALVTSPNATVKISDGQLLEVSP